MRMQIALVILLAGFVTAALAQDQQIKVSGIYSDLAYNQEGGDLLGMELLIIPSDPSGYRAFVQIAEGGPPFTVIVPLVVNGSRVEFTLPSGSPYSGEHFVGTFSATGLVLHWRRGQVEKLKRGKSYWQ
jgi:hypothetical protein